MGCLRLVAAEALIHLLFAETGSDSQPQHTGMTDAAQRLCSTPAQTALSGDCGPLLLPFLSYVLQLSRGRFIFFCSLLEHQFCPLSAFSCIYHYHMLCSSVAAGLALFALISLLVFSPGDERKRKWPSGRERERDEIPSVGREC